MDGTWMGRFQGIPRLPPCSHGAPIVCRAGLQHAKAGPGDSGSHQRWCVWWRTRASRVAQNNSGNLLKAHSQQFHAIQLKSIWSMIYSIYSAYSTCFLFVFVGFYALPQASWWFMMHVHVPRCGSIPSASQGMSSAPNAVTVDPNCEATGAMGQWGRRVTCGIRSAICKLRIRSLKALRRSRYVKMWRIVEVRLSGAIARGNLNFDMDLAFQY